MKGKKILALLLALMLVVGSWPFSALAAETPTNDAGTESSSGIEWSESVLDVPVLYAQDPYDKVKNDLEGGSSDMTKYGVTREAIVAELEAHENDSFYLGTPYHGDDWQSPNGDTSYNGSAGMNCGGFVSYVLRKAGMNADTVMSTMLQTSCNIYGSGKPYDVLAGADNFYNLIQNGNLTAYVFETKQDLLRSGLAEKGDLILMY